MVKRKVKKISVMALAGVMSLGMMIGSFSFTKAAEPANEAKITVGKTLTINGTKFPNIETFEFKLEAVQGYTNPNTSTSVDGQIIEKSAIPMPTGTTGTSATKTVGDFTQSATGDTAIARTRSASFPNIKYTTAGYYMYRMTEVIPTSRVKGVSYDESSYYVIVYVVNNTDSNNNTIDGVHVESITAWHNSKDAPNANMPNLKDIANKGYTKNHDPSASSNDNNTGDNNGLDPVDNSTLSSTDQRYNGLGKVGISNPKNELDATKFWNKQEMHDINITKNVKGTLGDKTKQFEFTVTLTGLESGGEYALEKTGTPILGEASKGQIAATKITANQTGECTFVVKMSDDQGISIKNLPNNATYHVNEVASNHAPSYKITSNSNATEYIYTAHTVAEAKSAEPTNPPTVYYTSNTGSDEVANLEELEDDVQVYTKTRNSDAPVISKSTDDTNGEKETALATNTEVVDATDGTITIAYTNTRDIETITGIPSMAIYFGIAGIIVLLGLVAMRKRKDTGLVEM